MSGWTIWTIRPGGPLRSVAQVIVRPFVVSGVARIALIVDSVGAHVGLWESIERSAQEIAHGP